MKDLMSIFSNTKAIINQLQMIAEMYYEGNINVVNGDFNKHIEIEQNLVKVGNLQGVIEDIQTIDYLITKNEYDKEVRVYIYKEITTYLEHNFLWAFLYLKGIAQVGITNEKLDTLIEQHRKEFEFDVYKTMVKEAFEKQKIKVKW